MNDPALTERVKNALIRELGAAVRDTPLEMASEDFAESLHSAQFAPDREPTLKAAIAAEAISLRTLMPKAR